MGSAHYGGTATCPAGYAFHSKTAEATCFPASVGLATPPAFCNMKRHDMETLSALPGLL